MNVFLNKYIYLITALLAAIIALPLFFLLPRTIYQKYIARPVYQELFIGAKQVQYEDLDNDNYSEKIHSYIPNQQTASVIISSKSRITGQWNFKGQFPSNRTRLMTGDFNKNGFSELYFFILSGDSLWIHWFEPMNDVSGPVQKIFVDVIKPGRDVYEAHIIPGGMFDMDQDGFPDLVFAVNATYSASPRRVYIFDVKNQRMKKSELFGAGIIGMEVFDNLNNGQHEILLQVASYNNTDPGSIPYDDNSCWLMVFDNHLNCKFKPVELSGTFGWFYVTHFQQNEQHFYYGLHKITGEWVDSSAVYLFNHSGELIKKQFIDAAQHEVVSIPFVTSYRGKEQLVFYNNASGEMQLLNTELEKKMTVDNWETVKYPLFMDVDSDRNNEILLFNQSSTKLRIFNAGLHHPVTVPVAENATHFNLVSLKKEGDVQPSLAVQSGKSFNLIDYYPNPLYAWRIPVFTGVYLLALLITILIQKIGRRQLRQKMELERQLSSLHINNILNQLDPHFTFNALNTIATYVLTEEKERAHNHLIRFSKLIRSSLADADEVARTLKLEMETVKNYLDLQQQAYPGRFDYIIAIGDKVNMECKIPKLIVQTHVENALKHGILPREKKGTVKITAETRKNYTTITIEDNGIGRKEAAKQNQNSTGKGIELFNSYISWFNKFNPRKMKQEIIDLNDDKGLPKGTKVVLRVPEEYKYAAK
jgi:two-component sensor histidine kinase